MSHVTGLRRGLCDTGSVRGVSNDGHVIFAPGGNVAPIRTELRAQDAVEMRPFRPERGGRVCVPHLRGARELRAVTAGRQDAASVRTEVRLSNLAHVFHRRTDGFARLRVPKSRGAIGAARGVQLANTPHVDFNSGLCGGGWGEWTIAEFLRREAQTLIEAQGRCPMAVKIARLFPFVSFA